jgi:GntR family transcriptional regulator
MSAAGQVIAGKYWPEITHTVLHPCPSLTPTRSGICATSCLALADTGYSMSIANSARSIAAQVSDLLVARITTAQWAAGQELPPLAELASTFGVSSCDVLQALDQLESQRIIIRTKDHRVWVADYDVERRSLQSCRFRDANGVRLEGDVEVLSIEHGHADTNERGCLRLSSGTPVTRIRRLRRTFGRPFVYERSVIPAHLFRDVKIDETLRQSISVLAQCNGLAITSFDERCRPSFATPEVLCHLPVPANCPVLKINRIAFAGATPIEWRAAWCHLVNETYIAEL